MPSGDVYERLERIARDEGPGFRMLRQRLIEVFLIVASIFFLGYLLYVAQFSGTVRWFLGFAVIAIVSLYAWHAVARGTAEPVPLAKVEEPSRPRVVELAFFTSVARRAIQGLPYSLVAVSSRAREAFEERARLARGLTPDGMRALEGDARGLEAAFRDPALADFLYLPPWESEARYRWVRAARSREGFEAAFGKMLDRMEGWR